MDRNLALEAVRVTEAAALNCARWTGRGDEKAADQAAVDAMRKAFDALANEGGTFLRVMAAAVHQLEERGVEERRHCHGESRLLERGDVLHHSKAAARTLGGHRRQSEHSQP